MPIVKGSNTRSVVAHRRRETHIKRPDRDKLYPYLVTINMLPDDVLVEMFDSYLNQDSRVDAWHTLVHVCRRWRCLVFTLPRRLNIRILCTLGRPVTMTLRVWPALPIVIDAEFVRYQPRGTAPIITVLQKHDRVCKIDIRCVPNSLLKKFATMKKPFPALTELKVSSLNRTAQVIPDTFLAGSTPCLRSLWLVRIPFPTVGKLLLSTSGLVDLGLWNIPQSGYISPEAMVTTLSALTRLKKFVLGFEYPLSHGHQASRPPLRDTRAVLPALTMLYFKGDCEYLEDLVSRIDAPILERVKITFFCESERMFDTPLLRDFIGRTEMLCTPHRAEVIFYAFSVEITLFGEQGMPNDEIIKMGISSRLASGRLSALGQVCNSIIPPHHMLERLGIYEYNHEQLYWGPDLENTPWLELLRVFTGVKDLALSKTLFQLVAHVMQELAGGRVTEVLPVLQNIVLEGPRPSGSMSEAIRRFVVARQRSGFPVTIKHST